MKNKINISKGIIIIIIIFALILTGCAQADKGRYIVNGKEYHFAGIEFSPHFPNAPEAYAYATDQGELLQYIPCYCGCDVAPFHHTSVKSCFIQDNNEQEEERVYDDHGSVCALCIQIVLDVQEGKKEGLSLQEIRDQIDKNYERFAPPTPTENPPKDY